MPVQPQRDGEGNILPHDHPEILPEYHLIRHIVPKDLHREQDTGRVRVASGAYSESSDAHGGMSVDIEEWIAADGLPPLHYVVDRSHGAVRLNVGRLRGLGFQVGWDPLEHNPHHGAVWNIGNGSRRKRRIAESAETIRKALGED